MEGVGGRGEGEVSNNEQARQVGGSVRRRRGGQCELWIEDCGPRIGVQKATEIKLWLAMPLAGGEGRE